ncbi:MAG: GNAT family N-acetyltransferase [Chloroflexota bacterium]
MDFQIVRTLHPPEGIIQQIAHLNARLGYPSTPADTRRRLEALPREDRLLLALGADALFGYAHIRVVRDLLSEESAEVVAIAVDPAFRRQGVGRRLVTAAEIWARESGRSRLILRTNVIVKEAHAFFVALGYEKVETSLVFMRDLESERKAEAPTQPL